MSLERTKTEKLDQYKRIFVDEAAQLPIIDILHLLNQPNTELNFVGDTN